MTNAQLYISITPSLATLIVVILAWLSNRSDITRLSDKIDGIQESLRAEMTTLRRDLHTDMMLMQRELHKDMMFLHERVVKVEQAH